MNRKVGIVVVIHGSRRPEANERVGQFVAELRARLRTDCIEPAHMEHAQPTVSEAIERLLARGCNHIYGLLLLLLPGTHSSRDIPSLFEQTLRQHPGVTWELGPPLLEDPAMLDFVVCRLQPILPT